MRILQVHPFLQGDRINPFAGGETRASLLLTQYLLEHGHDVAIFPYPERLWGSVVVFGITPGQIAKVMPTMTFPGRKTALPDWWRLQTTRASRSRTQSNWQDMFFMAGLRAAVAKLKPGIVHVHDPHSDFPRLYKFTNSQKPLVLTHQSGQDGQNLSAYRHIVCTSESTRAGIAAVGGYPAKQTSVIYPPVAELFRAGAVAFAADRTGLAFVGPLTAEKGVDLLIDAYRMSSELNHQSLRFCGPGDEREEYSKIARANKLNFRFEGQLDPEGVRSIVGGARFIVAPSRSEGFSMAMLEALACGTPVIGWSPQVRELEARWGLRLGVPFDARIQTATELSQSIQLALEEDAAHIFAHDAIAARAREEFSIKRCGEATLRAYAEARSFA